MEITNRPKLSIMVQTYNHVNFIEESLLGILNQKTDYSFEIHVVDDCSTDGTQDIILKYQKMYPNIIRAHINKTNIGTLDPPLQKVFAGNFSHLNGEYISFLEGDDYWSSFDKIQKQVDFLEANPIYSACSHNTIRVFEDKSQPDSRFLYWKKGVKPDHTILDFIAMTSFFHTSSVIYRNQLNGVPNKYFSNKWSCDIYNTMVHVAYGPLRHLDEDMSVYRIHKGGNYSSLPEATGRIFNINSLRRYNYWFRYRYCYNFAYTIYRLCKELLAEHKLGKHKISRFNVVKLVIICRVYGCLHWTLSLFRGSKIQSKALN